MTPLLRFGIFFPLLGTAVAGPGETAIVAAMALSAAPNYTWVSTVSDDAGTYLIDGKTQGAGQTWVKMPMPRGLAQRLGRDAETQLEMFLVGDQPCVVRSGDDWKFLHELSARSETGANEPFARAMGRMPGGRMGTLGRPLPATVVSRGGRFGSDDDASFRESASPGVSRPHEDLAIIVSSHETLVCEGPTASGTLTDLGAQLLLVREGQTDVTPVSAQGTFKLWFQEGRVARYQLRLEGILLVGGKTAHVRQTSETTLSRVGTTRFDVPREVREKLRQ